MDLDVRVPDWVLLGGCSYQVLTSCLIVKPRDRMSKSDQITKRQKYQGIPVTALKL
jgi:hypothetical protein